jgi:hypothetical protein
MLLLASILDALQIDTWRRDIDFPTIKKAFTPDVVRRIFDAVRTIWPDLEDYERCHLEDHNSISALYTGTYEPEAIFKALTRHALYAEKIYLVDPFLHPLLINQEFNPLFHPDKHRANAIKFTFLWLSLYPWIDAGIVNFIRSPTDFIPGLKQEVVRLSRERHNRSPELAALTEEHVDDVVSQMSTADRGMTEYFMLSYPDDWFIAEYNRRPPPKDIFPTVEDFLKYINWRRDSHPYYIARLPGQTAEVLYETSGANYELAKRICSITGSHLITDWKSRWKEIELDRRDAGIDMAGWTPFAKALQNSDLKVLNNVTLNAAFTLRRENRLDSLRNFFHRVWRSCREPNEFSDKNAANLTAELDHCVKEAKAEWDKIDRELVKWFGVPGAATITAGIAGFVPAAPALSAAAVAGVVGLIQSRMKRTSLKDQFPASFFLTIKR